MKRIIIASVVCFVLLWCALSVWNWAHALANLTGLSYHVFDGLAFVLGVLALLSTEIANDDNYKKMTWKDKNSGKHPADPDYDRDYDADEDLRRWEDEQELKELLNEGN